MMGKQNKISLYIFIGLVGICIIYVLFRSYDLKRNGITVKGKILDYAFSAKSSVREFEYEFLFNGKYYKSSSPAGVTNSSEFIDKVFPVRFSSKTGKSEILVTPRDFRRYGMQYPDSLEWVKKYLIKPF